jgi:outer membrane lipoprotein-sorting protein
MNQFNVPMESDLLDEATELLRDTRGVDMPQGLVATTVDAITNRPAPVANRGTVGSLSLRFGSIAAILLTLVVITTVFTQGGARVALAQVIDKVKDADSVEFVLGPGRGDNAGNQQKCLLSGKRLRVQHPVGIVMIADRETKKGLYLDAKNKTSSRFTLHKHLATEFAADPITQLRQMKADDATRVGQEVVNGKETEVFRVRGVNLFGTKSDKGETRVWVDPTTMLPVRVELRMGESPVLTLKEIQWGSKIDPSLLVQEIPDGYSDQPEDAFRKRLQPAGDPDKRLTPTEAFRKWRGDNQ